MISVPVADVFESLAERAYLECQTDPANWNNSAQRCSMGNYTNVDVKPEPFRMSEIKNGITWTASQVSCIGAYAVQLWKCNNDNRLMVLISFYPRFPVIIKRIKDITRSNVKETVKHQLHEITLDDIQSSQLPPADAPDAASFGLGPIAAANDDSEREKLTSCAICMDEEKPRVALFAPCGHLAACLSCYHAACAADARNARTCPICKAEGKPVLMRLA